MIDGTSLADILNNYQSRKAFTDSSNEMLINSTGVNTFTHVPKSIVSISLWAYGTDTIYFISTCFAVTVAGFLIIDLVLSASIAQFIIIANL